MNNQNARQESNEAGPGPASSLLHRTDLAVTAVLLAVAGFLYWRTLGFDEIPASLAQNVQPTVFPQMILALIILLALALPFEHLIKRRQGIDVDKNRRDRLTPVVYLTAVAIFVVVGSMAWIGTYLGLILAAAALPLLWGERRATILVPYALIFPTFVMWFFAGVLEVTFLPGFVGQVFR
jgi:hypothetical protein